MRFEVNGNSAYAATGGRQHEAGRPWIVFIHGSGFNHLTWILQTRTIAYDGWNVLAPDLPAHHLSEGEPLRGIDAMADWVLVAMDAAGCREAVICGHSMGGLIALEIARKAPERVRGIVFAATALAIPVNEKLIEMARHDEQHAFQSMVAWAFGPEAHVHDHTWPGASHIYSAIDMMSLNCEGTLLNDLESCAGYRDGATAARAIRCPTLCVFSKLDRMTPLKGGLALAEHLKQNETIVLEDCGHSLPSERPREFNAALRRFLDSKISKIREPAHA